MELLRPRQRRESKIHSILGNAVAEQFLQKVAIHKIIRAVGYAEKLDGDTIWQGNAITAIPGDAKEEED
jgi:hypothetical protein